MKKKFLIFITYLTIILIVLQTALITYTTYKTSSDAAPSGAVVKQGKVTICITEVIDVLGSADFTLYERQNYSAKFNHSQTNLTVHMVSYCPPPKRNPGGGPIFQMTSDGWINFTPDESYLEADYSDGRYICQISVIADESWEEDECFACNDTWPMFIVKDYNYAPYPIANLSDTVWPANTSVSAFVLDEYFADPDNDTLRYNVTGNENIIITILNSSEVYLSSSWCGIENVFFTAIDISRAAPHNLTNYSNWVKLEASCATEGSGSGGAAGEGAGGASMGGAGMSLPCVPEWKCFPWGDCQPDGSRTRQCVDVNGCDADRYEQYLTESCEYKVEENCVEDWHCDEWAPCQPDNTQTRECYDQNDCGTQNNMPPATQSCIYIGTCSDDIKNCHDDACEEGVDCGGPCDPCAEVQMPIPIDAQAKITPLLIITTISAALLILLYGYFHKQINASVAKLGWKLAGQIIKPILLADKEKKIIMEMLLALEKRLKKAKKLKESRMIISSIMRYFYKKLMDLPSAFKMDEFNVKIKRLKYPETLNRILTSFAEKIIDLESGKLPLNQLEIENMIEESRVLVYLTSRFVKEDIGKEIAEKKIETTGVSKIEKTRLMIYNTYIAMLFNEVEICKKKYIEIINIYDDLHPDKKKKIYEDFARLFDEIKYVISWKI